jgi:DNA-binding transcriptional LysR family regulator
MMKELDWQQVPYFLAVARSGSLRGAAEQLNANHGTIDRHLKSLETTYGVQLFSRSRKGLTLTPAGEVLLPIAEEAESSLLSARRKLTGLDREETGKVRVSLPGILGYYVMAPVFARFFQAYPGIDLEIRLTDSFENIEGLETDVSIRAAYEVSDDVVGRKLFPLGVGVFASRHYLERHLPDAGPRGEGLHWIGWGGANPIAGLIEQSPFPQAEIRHTVTDTMMHLHLLRSGFGMSPMLAYCNSVYPDLIQVPGTELMFDRSIWLLLHSDLSRTTRVRRFVDFVALELKKIRPLLQGELVGRQL